MHTHATVLHNVAGAAAWKHIDENVVALATAPFFHVTGLVHSFLSAIYAGGTMVIQRRWDPLEAARLVERYRCTHWDNVPTMVVDLLSHPEALKHDISLAEVDLRRRRGDARGDRAEALRPVRRALHRGLRHDRDHLADAHQPAAEPEEAVPRHPRFRYGSAGRRSGNLEVQQSWSPRRNRGARTAAADRLLEEPKGLRRILVRGAGPAKAGSSAPATSAAPTRTATSTSPTASSA